MSKKLKCMIVVLIVTASSIVMAHADPNFGYGYAFTGSPSGVINIGWDALSAMCAECNRDMKAGYFGTGAVNDSCRIVWGSVGGSTGWFISRINQSGSYTNTYLGNSANDLVYFSAYATYDQLNGIYSLLSNIYSRLGDINTNISAILSNASHISLNTDAIYTRLGQAYTELINIESNTSYLSLIDNVLRNIKNDTTYLSTIEADIRNLESTVSTQFGNVITGQNNLYNLELSMAQLLTTTNNTLSAILGKMPAQLSLDCVATSGTPYITLPYNVAVNMVSEINNKYIGSEFTIYTRNNHTVEGTYILDYANLESGEGGTRMYIKLTGHNANTRITGWYGSYIGSNNWMMYTTTNNGTGGTIDDTNIIQAIDRIYDWLDNADLATNNTIINVVNNSNQDVNNANGLYDLVRSLFKTAYGNLDDSTNISDWTSAGNYFGNLWSDPEP